MICKETFCHAMELMNRQLRLSVKFDTFLEETFDLPKDYENTDWQSAYQALVDVLEEVFEDESGIIYDGEALEDPNGPEPITIDMPEGGQLVLRTYAELYDYLTQNMKKGGREDD